MESIMYPCVNIIEGPGKYFSRNMNDYTDVLYFIENNGFAHLWNIVSFCSFYHMQYAVIFCLIQH